MDSVDSHGTGTAVERGYLVVLMAAVASACGAASLAPADIRGSHADDPSCVAHRGCPSVTPLLACTPAFLAEARPFEEAVRGAIDATEPVTVVARTVEVDGRCTMLRCTGARCCNRCSSALGLAALGEGRAALHVRVRDPALGAAGDESTV